MTGNPIIDNAAARADRAAWPEAMVVAEPVKEAGKPIVLVKRRQSDISGPNGEEMIYLPGNPLISLFTGCGGMDIGAERAGFVTLVQHEWNGGACQTLIGNRPTWFRHAALIQGDLRQTPTSMLLAEAFGNPDLARIRLIETDETRRAEYELLTHAPGVRYFPDRPVLIPPNPVGPDGCRSKTFLEFYRRLEENEPDRIIRQPR